MTERRDENQSNDMPVARPVPLGEFLERPVTRESRVLVGVLEALASGTPVMPDLHPLGQPVSHETSDLILKTFTEQVKDSKPE